jgi:uncharacterized protein with GYD domain
MPVYVLLMNLTEVGVDRLRPSEDSEGREFAAFEESLADRILRLAEGDGDTAAEKTAAKTAKKTDDEDGDETGAENGEEHGAENGEENGGEPGDENGDESAGEDGEEAAGGLRALFWTLGAYDIVAIADLRSDLSAAAVALWLAQTHGVRTTTMPAFTKAEVTPGEEGSNVFDALYRCHWERGYRRTDD